MSAGEIDGTLDTDGASVQPTAFASARFASPVPVENVQAGASPLTSSASMVKRPGFVLSRKATSIYEASL